MSERPFGAGCVVIAEFEVKQHRFGDFLALAQAFSRACLDNEPGCMQFDVVQLETTVSSALFYEAYKDTTAFEAHCQSVHLARFKKEFPEMIVAEKPLRRGIRGQDTSQC